MTATPHLDGARLWLTGHGLTGVTPTPMLAARLAARHRARVASALLVAGLLIAMALAYVAGLPLGSGGFGPTQRWSLAALTALVAGVMLGQHLIDRWVRRVDQRAGAALTRRAAHPYRLGWRAVLGLPRAALAAVTYAGAAAMAIRALAEPDARFGAVILLIGLSGAAATLLVQLRHVMTRPAVADDEATLTADLIIRVEDAREAALPTVVWSLPVVSVFSTDLGWWNTGWLVFIVLGTTMLMVITFGTARSSLVARRATAAR